MKLTTSRGPSVTSRSNRRFVLVHVYRGVHGERASIVKRSDSVATLWREINRQGFWAGRTFHVFDQTTGREIEA